MLAGRSYVLGPRKAGEIEGEWLGGRALGQMREAKVKERIGVHGSEALAGVKLFL
jgi:hypothetical protein